MYNLRNKAIKKTKPELSDSLPQIVEFCEDFFQPQGNKSLWPIFYLIRLAFSGIFNLIMPTFMHKALIM